MYRQGDVLIIPTDSIPTTATAILAKGSSSILAEGEVTGHAHRMPHRTAKLFRTEENERFLRVMGPAPVALKHEEHKPVHVPPGNYKVVIHTEYVPGALPRQVAD